MKVWAAAILETPVCLGVKHIAFHKKKRSAQSKFLANRKKTRVWVVQQHCSTAEQELGTYLRPHNEVDLWSLGGITQKGHLAVLVKPLTGFPYNPS